MGLQAEYIKINTSQQNIRAEGRVLDTVTKEYVQPVFSEGETTYDVDSMDYNMTSHKGLIHGVKTKEGEGTLFGGTVKKMKDNTVHMHQGRYTVCDADCPHFYMQMTKGTTTPGKQTVFGPSYLVFEDVPIYFLGLPFGFFPMNQDKKGGLIFPEIGEEYVKGFFVRNGGWYQPIGDYADIAVVGGVYTLGSWQMGATSNYALRYKFRGNFSFDYARDKFGEPGSADFLEQTSTSLRWTHSQDSRFMPGSTFSASVNYSSSNYNRYNAQDLNDYLSAQTSSTVNYTKAWTGTPFSLTANASLSQNTRDSTVSLVMPSLSFNVTRIAPFKRKIAVGGEKWYEKISFTYNMNAKAQVDNLEEDLLFQSEMLEKARMGVQHSIPVNATFTALNYLNITPSVNYGERWYFRRVDRSWDDVNEQVVQDTTRGFYRLWDVSASLSFNTKLYGTYQVGRGLRQKPTLIRHLFTPSFGFSFTPDNGSRYMQSVQSDNTGTSFTEYSPWAQELYGTPSSSRSASMSIGFSNSLEAKFPSRKDSTGYKKVTLIDQLSMSTSYNFIADSMNLSNISMSLTTNLLDKLPINVSASFDPYAVDKDGRRINEFLINQGKGLARLASASFSFSYNWSSGASRSNGQAAVNNPNNNSNTMDMLQRQAADDFFTQNPEQQMSSADLARMAATQYYDFQIPWSFGFSYTFSYSNPGSSPTTQQTLNFNGSVNLSEKWAVTASAGYDLIMKKLTPGTVRVTRDLHCWQMSFSWVPVGFRQSWSFNIAVKSSMLSDILKYDKNNSFLDNFYTYN